MIWPGKRDLEERFRRRFLDLLERAERLSTSFHETLLSWRKSGFSVDATQRVGAGEVKRMERLARSATRAPVAAHALRQKPDGRVEIDTPPDPKTESTVPVLDRLDVEAIYVASAELIDRLPASEREALFPPQRAARTMGITGFTLPTTYRWVKTNLGRSHTLHPFRKGHYLGSGPGRIVLHEAGLDAEGQLAGIRAFADALDRS